MKRNAVDRGQFRLRAVLIAALVVIGGATLFLTFMAPKHLARKLPLGISASELAFYANWLDRDRSDAGGASLPVYELPRAPVSTSEVRVPLRNGAHTGEVVLRATPGLPGAMRVQSRDPGLLGVDPLVELHPATTDDIRYKYLQVLAEELGLLSPEVGFVRVRQGEEEKLYRRVAVPDAVWLARHGVLDAVPFRKGFDPARPDHVRPDVEADAGRAATLATLWNGLCPNGRPADLATLQEHVDLDAVAAWFLMLRLEGDPAPFGRTHTFFLRESTGRIMPVYTPSTGRGPASAGPTTCDPFTPLLDDPGFQQRIQAQREKLLDVRGHLRERFAAQDQALVAPLAGDGSVRLVQARARAYADTLLDQRLMAPLGTLDLSAERVPPTGWAVLQGPAETIRRPVPSVGGGSLADIRRRYWVEMRGDTVVFRRARYKVEEDLIIPPGHPVLMLSGARIEISPGRHFVVQGPFEVRATDLNPVFIRAAGSAPYAAVVVKAHGAPVQIKGLRISGGSGATLNEPTRSAMLHIEEPGQVAIAHTHIDMEHSGDALLVDGGRLQLSGGRITGGRAMLRRVQGRVNGASLTNTGRQRARTGLHVAGGRLVVDSTTFEGFADAALSADDGAQLLVRDGRFITNGTAIRSGDLSAVHVDGAMIERNAVAFQVPPPGPDATAGRLVLYANTLVGNTREQDIATEGSVDRRSSLDAAVRAAFGVR